MTDPVYTRDWSDSRMHWNDLFLEVDDHPDREILEIGCFEGQATRWFLDRWPSCHVMVVDPFSFEGQWVRFATNVDYSKRAGNAGRVAVVEGRSQEVLPRLFAELADAIGARQFDLVYVDGSHSSPHVLSDAVDAFRFLKPGGWMLFDDYDATGVTPGVRPAVDAFVECYADLLTGWDPVGRDQYLVVKR